MIASLITCWVALLLLCPPLSSQDLSSRAQELERARQQKAQNLQPEPQNGLQNAFKKAKEMLPLITGTGSGFYMKFGGAGGISAGPAYVVPRVLGGELQGAAQFSVTQNQKYELQFTAPGKGESPAVFDLYGMHRDYPRVNYYGPGPDSQKGARSNYRLEETAFSTALDIRMAPHLHIGPALGYLMINVGPGKSSSAISTERVFSVPGVERQGNFVRYGAFVELDYRDHPGAPRNGGNYRLAYSRYNDRSAGLYDFDRWEVHAQQFIPFFNEQRVFALRARAVRSLTHGASRVPFYLQPTLGGADSLRGFRTMRFYDDNSLTATVEYRWQAFSAMEMALFADAGKVFSQHAAWDLRHLESAAGFGMRFLAFHDVFLRLDVGFSNEGYQVWIKFDHIFEEDPERSPLKRTAF
jgi:hypothetical protein